MTTVPPRTARGATDAGATYGGGQTSTAAAAAPPPRPARPPADAAAVDAARAALAALFGEPARRRFAVRFWDGSVDAPDGATPAFTLVVRHEGALRRAFVPPSEMALVEAYLHDDLDVEGELEAAATLSDDVAAALRSPVAVARLARTLLALPRTDGRDAADEAPDGRRGPAHFRGARRHTKRRDAAAVRYHYDVGNDFYALWLDRRMQYSCAYFPTGGETIEAAQEAKLEHICRKLRLQEGERLLDVGCGWGGLLEYAATRHGVRGLGITLSERQAAAARARLAAAGVADRCAIEVRDYRDLEGEGAFDKIVSVGMREHVGRARMPAYFATAHRLLRPGGLFLDHGITRAGAAEAARGPNLRARIARRLWRRDEFIERYVFPDGELIPIGELLTDGERAGLEARDVENLREHYARTLGHWVRRLEARHDEAAAIVGETTYRVWRLYMSASAVGFRTGRLGLCQTLYAKPHASGRAELPATRADLYRD
jgi:cyclopropane-fatty-acyl-phospholipid synthase